MEGMDLNTVTLKDVIVHYVGNKNNGEPLSLSASSPELDEETSKLLTDGLLFRFKSIAELYAFQHASSLQYHEVYNYCKNLFDGATSFEETAALLARHL